MNSPQSTSQIDLYQSLVAPISHELAAVQSAIMNNLDSDVLLVKTVLTHVVRHQGKQLRPLLLLWIFRAFSEQPVAQHVYALAASIELIHTSTLLHDDVVDESDIRRGQQSTNTVFGNATSVLVGDFLYSRSFQLMLEAENFAVLKVLANTTNMIAQGEVMQLSNYKNFALSQAQYLELIHRKTGVLFSAAAEVGALCVTPQPPNHIIDAVREIGKLIGCIFQLMDDILDYFADATLLGKNLGDDYKDGRVTLPIIYALEQVNANAKTYIQDLFDTPSPIKFAELIKILQTEKILKRCEQLMLETVTEARQLIERTFPQDTAAKTALLTFCDYSLIRQF